MAPARSETPAGLQVRQLERPQASRELAAEIVALVRARQAAGRPCVLGLATGSTPREVYAELVRAARAGELSFEGVTTVNLDEYLGLAAGDPNSFRAEMRRALFDAVGLGAERALFPPADGGAEGREQRCQAFEARLRALGGIDLQVLGVGRNGHLAFNEPGSARDSRTRVVELHALTRADAAARFGGLQRVPTHAVTLGLGTILEARSLRVLAFGESKRAVLQRALHGPVEAALPASFLREHPDCRLWHDAAAAAAR